jgi:hypothetical protein
VARGLVILGIAHENCSVRGRVSNLWLLGAINGQARLIHVPLLGSMSKWMKLSFSFIGRKRSLYGGNRRPVS